ncbi:MAG: dTDP-glucose 4,6-dehydratase [Bacteroidetes bacterium]|jgi:dTDP-glucose 4,6-dehydratase|nr:dTDP-glucose 4,6-dehydratase [Bacteroidota bacterium]MBK8328562.1 dTDP-glucose 4,6-dehydratase [Bacteroidota bacterium]MBK9300507.1 dTDP-glucose 4,6-dehydratase [Bacteroidota bacterium]HMT36733.1 dTDP-glucose 4,6-dehydratase [Chitinophagaceae bacterium]
MIFEKNILITGGAGFIGSHVVRLFVTKYPSYRIVNVDDLTYAGNLENLKDIENNTNYIFVKANICDTQAIEHVMAEYQIDTIIHLAAESHVDRSITDPLAFVNTNIVGTANLLINAKKAWLNDMTGKLFYHVSTDEVYGSLGETGFFTETTAYDPRSPYSASKAASDHLVMSFFHTYHLPVIISNCSNNYGPNHFPEKLIPLSINNIIQKKPLPIYGKGENVRDWLYVIDHAHAIDIIVHQGKIGETYNIGGHNEWKNIDLIRLLCKLMDEKLGNAPDTSLQLITFVKDRAGHDLRYAIDASKIQHSLGWTPSVTFEEGLSKTIDWYLANTTWLQHVTSGDYLTYYKSHYENV